ncbi:MAG: heme-binding protein, partial [Planctomycetaceae bacterium]
MSPRSIVLSVSLVALTGSLLAAEGKHPSNAASGPMAEATSAASIKTIDGFKVERLYSVPPEQQGSWVSLTHDNKGRLITSDQYGKLYRVTPGSSEADTKVEPIDIEVGMAQGLLYAFDSLYVMVNSTKPKNQGLWRLQDTDGDDKFDKTEHLRHLKGGGEHGPHAIVLSPDGKSLYVCAGNHTHPTEFESTLVPPNFEEDQLLPRMWDAGGHAVGKVAPGGWIANVSPDGSEWKL